MDKKQNRFKLTEDQENKKKEIKEKIKDMPLKELKKIPLHQSSENGGMKNYNDGDLIRYSNGSILYVVSNYKGEKVPSLITVIKDLSSEKISPERNNKNKFYLQLFEGFKNKINQIPRHKVFFGIEFFDSSYKIKKNNNKGKINLDYSSDESN